MIYISVRLAQNSATASGKLPLPEEANQFWLDPTPHRDEESQIHSLEENLEHSHVRWYRSQKVSYILRKP